MHVNTFERISCIRNAFLSIPCVHLQLKDGGYRVVTSQVEAVYVSVRDYTFRKVNDLSVPLSTYD